MKFNTKLDVFLELFEKVAYVMKGSWVLTLKEHEYIGYIWYMCLKNSF